MGSEFSKNTEKKLHLLLEIFLFKNTEKIVICWEWEYYIDDAHDIQDTNDARNIKRYIFNIETIVEE